ncbi:MAG TPA: class I SAM-dependent methyltransferase [Bacteroidales bacterium]|nr:class I SAM-dependent methyltransferase [Bacteroidales bacterium]HSA42437.1 class I SAM-dependent methyltransferase [Bacteroidales bacterium]
MKKTREHQHFEGISDKYQSAADTWSMMYDLIQERLDQIVKGRDVLDVGNGGKFSYDTRLPRRIIAMDISPAMMKCITDPGIEKLVGDARNMNIVADASVDIIVFQLVLHHIHGASLSESIDTLDSILRSSFQKLRPGGSLVIIEGLLSKSAYRIQASLFQLTLWILGRFGVSMIFFYNLSLFKKHVKSVFRVSDDDFEVVPLRLTGRIDPLGGSFPGLIKIPARLHPLNFTLLIIKKPC